GGIAEHAVDAQALLPVRVDLLRILCVLLRQVAPIFSDDVRSDRGQLVEEVVEVDDKVLEDREVRKGFDGDRALAHGPDVGAAGRSEEHTSELQSLAYIVCSLMLEKKILK